MWYQSQQPFTPSSPCKLGATDPEAHAHSPHRRDASIASISAVNPAVSTLDRPSHVSIPPPVFRTFSVGDPAWASVPLTNNVLIGEGRQSARRWTTRASSSDQSMPDYSQSITPFGSRDASLYETHNVHINPVQQNESQFDDLMAAISPTRLSGTHAPPTIRTSSAANSPPTSVRAPAVIEAIAASYHGQPRAVPVTTRDPPPPALRKSSDISMESYGSTKQFKDSERPNARTMEPAAKVRSRKENKMNDFGFSIAVDQRRVSTDSTSRRQKSSSKKNDGADGSAGDGKRKRESLASVSNVVSENLDGLGSSPTRKASKVGPNDEGNNAPAAEDEAARTLSGGLNNIS